MEAANYRDANDQKTEPVRHTAGESARIIPVYDWTKELKTDFYGRLQPTLMNLLLILENDPRLQGIVYNRMADTIDVLKPLPWRRERRYWTDADDAQLMCYLSENYGSFSRRTLETALRKVTDDRSFHPVVDYFMHLQEWDDVPRAERLLIDYLGAPDTPYVRAVTLRTLYAALYRLTSPGIKFDQILVLSGPQGIGKSTLISRLGMDWFSDSLSVSDMNDKTSAEKLQGYWILEIGEMAGMRKADLEKVKAFISRQDDKYRAAYGRNVTSHPRQCIFFGTTNNEDGYLRDLTGNRRFWTVPVTGKGIKKPWDLDRDTVDQIWAECFLKFDSTPLWLPPELEEEAERIQRGSMEADEREGLVRDYLELLLPVNWEEKSLFARRNYVHNSNDRDRADAWIPRDTVSNMEIWCECFGGEQSELHRKQSAEITAIMARIDGWKRGDGVQRTALYGPQRYYCRVQETEPLPALDDPPASGGKDAGACPEATQTRLPM